MGRNATQDEIDSRINEVIKQVNDRSINYDKAFIQLVKIVLVFII